MDSGLQSTRVAESQTRLKRHRSHSCDDLEGWGGQREGGSLGRGDHVPTADSC